LPTTRLFADGQGIRRRQRSTVTDGQDQPSVKNSSPSAKESHGQRHSLPTAGLSAKHSHRQRRTRVNGDRCRALCRQPGRQAVGKAMPRGGLNGGQSHLLCRWPPELAVGKEIFFFCFFLPIFSRSFLHQIQPTFKSWDNFEFFSYISLIISVSLNFSGDSKFEQQVHEIIDFFGSKNGIHDVQSMLRPYPEPRMK
jgi:hypothetical protein